MANIRLLQAKLMATKKPIVGLKFIDEIMPRKNTEMEPYYTCNLCGNIGESNAMANHVVQPGHIQKFFEKLFPGRPPLEKAYLEDQAQLYKDNDRLHFINTHRSDLLFPWPQGQAPWSAKQGGGGIAPPYARENIHQVRRLDIAIHTLVK
jgi:hypothetical protein